MKRTAADVTADVMRITKEWMHGYIRPERDDCEYCMVSGDPANRNALIVTYRPAWMPSTSDGRRFRVRIVVEDIP